MLIQHQGLVSQLHAIVVEDRGRAWDAPDLARVQRRDDGAEEVEQLARGAVKHGREGIEAILL